MAKTIQLKDASGNKIYPLAGKYKKGDTTTIVYQRTFFGQFYSPNVIFGEIVLPLAEDVTGATFTNVVANVWNANGTKIYTNAQATPRSQEIYVTEIGTLKWTFELPSNHSQTQCSLAIALLTATITFT